MDQEKIGAWIKKVRQSHQLTQKEFAQKYHVTFQAVSKWETGKSLPDIALLKQICEDENSSLDELLGTPKKEKRKPWWILFVITFFILLLFFFLKPHADYEFKTLSTTCSTFKLSGVAAYNKEKSSIYISNIESCEEDLTIYEEFESILYEKYEDTLKEVYVDTKVESSTLVEYLKHLVIKVEDYSFTCKIFQDSELYIELHAKDSSGKITTYQIPITLEEC